MTAATQTILRLAAALALTAGLAACGGAESVDHGPEVDETPAAALSAEQRQAGAAQAVTALDQHVRDLASGYARAPGFDDRIAPLTDGGQDRWSVTLQEGVAYRIVAGCDADCSDVDLYLENADGVVIDSDTLMDDYPVVNVTPTAQGRYTVRTTVFSCGSASACYTATRILQEQ
ncbi:hypothetical protein [Brevundimonas sp.]|uniref:hypothetical protein n=1 Tax=Brevundimonas sp. TaxID=1871086 RepID=UPI00391A76A0